MGMYTSDDIARLMMTGKYATVTQAKAALISQGYTAPPAPSMTPAPIFAPEPKIYNVSVQQTIGTPTVTTTDLTKSATAQDVIDLAQALSDNAAEIQKQTEIVATGGIEKTTTAVGTTFTIIPAPYTSSAELEEVQRKELQYEYIAKTEPLATVGAAIARPFDVLGTAAASALTGQDISKNLEAITTDFVRSIGEKGAFEPAKEFLSWEIPTLALGVVAVSSAPILQPVKTALGLGMDVLGGYQTTTGITQVATGDVLKGTENIIFGGVSILGGTSLLKSGLAGMETMGKPIEIIGGAEAKTLLKIDIGEKTFTSGTITGSSKMVSGMPKGTDVFAEIKGVFEGTGIRESKLTTTPSGTLEIGSLDVMKDIVKATSVKEAWGGKALSPLLKVKEEFFDVHELGAASPEYALPSGERISLGKRFGISEKTGILGESITKTLSKTEYEYLKPMGEILGGDLKAKWMPIEKTMTATEFKGMTIGGREISMKSIGRNLDLFPSKQPDVIKQFPSLEARGGWTEVKALELPEPRTNVLLELGKFYGEKAQTEAMLEVMKSPEISLGLPKITSKPFKSVSSFKLPSITTISAEPKTKSPLMADILGESIFQAPPSGKAWDMTGTFGKTGVMPSPYGDIFKGKGKGLEEEQIFIHPDVQNIVSGLGATTSIVSLPKSISNIGLGISQPSVQRDIVGTGLGSLSLGGMGEKTGQILSIDLGVVQGVDMEQALRQELGLKQQLKLEQGLKQGLKSLTGTPLVTPRPFNFTLPSMMPKKKKGQRGFLPREYQYTPTVFGMTSGRTIRKAPSDVGVQSLGIRFPVMPSQKSGGLLGMFKNQLKMDLGFSPRPKRRTNKRAKKRYDRNFFGKLGI